MKKVYWESVKKWALRAGIPAGVAGFALLFYYLVYFQAIVITSHSGDMACAGTPDDPCLAFINFTVKEDVLIYPIGYDPYGRDTPFATDIALKEWRMYRRWGNGWREIDLTKGCTGSWCGCYWCRSNNAAKYSYAFRENRSYEIKIVAYKNRPEETIKWSFGPVDPFWYGTQEVTSLNVELGTPVSITANLTEAEAVCVDIDHPDYGDRYVCNNSGNYVNFTVNITYFRNNQLNDSSTEKTLIYDESDILCYQEFANVSNDCGGLGSGSYREEILSGGAYVYINYTKPAKAISAIWQVKHGGLDPYNITIPDGCFNEDTLQLRIYSSEGGSRTRSLGQCLNGSAWLTLTKGAEGSPVGGSVTSVSNVYDGNWGTGATYNYQVGKWLSQSSPYKGMWYEEAIIWNLEGFKTFYIRGHSSDDVVGMTFNLTRFISEESYPSDLKVYVNGTFSNDVSFIGGDIEKILTTFDGGSEQNLSFIDSGTQTAHFSLPKYALVNQSYFNLTGYSLNLNKTYERQLISGGTPGVLVETTNDLAQTFTVGYVSDNVGFTLKNISVRYDTATGSGQDPGVLEIYLMGVDGSGAPNGTVLSTGSYDVGPDEGKTINVSMSPYTLQPSTQYAIVYHCTNCGISPNRFIFLYGYSDCVSTPYGGGKIFEGSGSSWSSSGCMLINDFYFEVHGNYTYSPSNVSVEVGIIDGDKEFSQTGDFLTTNRTEDLSYAINESLYYCSDDICQVNIYVTSDTAGKIRLSDLFVNYSISDSSFVTVNTSLIQSFLGNSSGFVDIPFSISSTTKGGVNISDIRFDYMGGNDTINILIYSNYSYGNYTTFDKGAKELNITILFENVDYPFHDGEGQIQRLTMQKNRSVVEAYFNLSGYIAVNQSDWQQGQLANSSSFESDNDGWTLSGCSRSNSWSSNGSWSIYTTSYFAHFEKDVNFSEFNTIVFDYNSSSKNLGGRWRIRDPGCSGADYYLSDLIQGEKIVYNRTIGIPVGIKGMKCLQYDLGFFIGSYSFNYQYIDNIRLVNSTLSYPTNVTVKVGDDIIFNYPGEFNQENNRTSDFSDTLNDYLDSCTPTDGDCVVNFTFTADTHGIVKYSDIFIKYRMPTKKDINDTLNIDYYFSDWDFNFPEHASYLEFIPPTPTSKNVAPYGQTQNTPIFNITTYNYGGKNMNLFGYLNETHSCVDLFMSTSNIKPSSSLWDGLVGYWPFDIDARDISIYGADGTVNGSVFNSSGFLGGAYTFDRIDGDAITIKSDATDKLGVAGSNYTISVWMYRHSEQDMSATEKWHNESGASSGQPYPFVMRNGPHCAVYNTTDYFPVSITGDAPLNQWIMVTCVFDENRSIYLNGVLNKTVTNPLHDQNINNSNPIIVGARTSWGAYGWNGSLDEFRIYNRSLSPAEIFELYNRTYNKYYDSKLSTEWQTINWDLEYLNNTKIWLWADYNCGYTTWHTWWPDLYIRGCCKDCVCSEDLT